MKLMAQSIVHRFGDLMVLDRVSVTIESGQVVAIVGPSGCGKSTLLQVLGGLLVPTAGDVMLDANGSDATGNQVAFVFQDFALLPWRSVAENVAFAIEHAVPSRTEREAIVADVLRRTGLSSFANALPKQLSGGMRQRVGIARALAARPSILLMDEPLSALDSQTREILLDDLTNLLEGDSLGVAYVTHNLEEAVKLADQVIVLSQRPGTIRETVTIDMSRRQRALPETAADMAVLQAKLWSLIRDGAVAADRELLKNS